MEFDDLADGQAEFWTLLLDRQQSVTYGNRDFFHFIAGIGTVIGKIWYRKKSRKVTGVLIT